MRILLIEPDWSLVESLRPLMKAENITIDWCPSFECSIDSIAAGSYDCVVLDEQLPDEKGIVLIEDTRRGGCTTPVLIISERKQAADVVRGINSGADDYLKKPFSKEEFLARVKALVRRASPFFKSDDLPVGNGVLSCKSRTLNASDKAVSLSEKECLLLECFARHQGEVLTRDQLTTYVWGATSEVPASELETYIYFLRKKFRTIHLKTEIETLHQRGYRLKG